MIDRILNSVDKLVYPYVAVIAHPVTSQKWFEMINWLLDNVDKENWRYTSFDASIVKGNVYYYNKFYFKDNESATEFKLRFG